jgi:iron complex transport system permease protein
MSAAVRPFTATRFIAVVLPCLLLLFAVLLITPWIGSTSVSWERVWNKVSPDQEIFFAVRLPRILFAALVGGALAVAGVLFQAILRNSLATPFTLGVSSGSSLGAVIAIWLGLDLVILGLPFVVISAFAGALATILLVFAIARSGHALPTATLLLAGVTLNLVFSAMVLVLLYASNFTQSFLMLRWMMGSLDGVDYSKLTGIVPLVLAAVGVLLWNASTLNPLAGGEEWASSRGVDVRRVMNIGYVTGSILTGAVTAFSGPIGFVGLIVPHSIRIIAGPDNRILIPASFFGGAAFLVVCDTVARTILAPAEIPVGAITALLGGPFFIVLLKRRRRELFL